MYYDEQIIDGVLCHRGDPKGEWIPFTEKQVAEMYIESKRVNSFYSSEIYRLTEENKKISLQLELLQATISEVF